MTDPGPAAGPSVVRRVAWNTVAQAIGKATTLAIGAASVAVTTRYLGAAGYGQLALALAFVQMVGVLADVGLLTVVVREISREPERTDRLVGNVLVLRLVLSLVVIATAAVVSLALPWTPEVRVAVLIAGVPLVLGLLNSAYVAVLQARLRMDRAVVADVAGRAAAFGALVAVVALDLGFYWVVATAGVGAAVTLCVTFVLVRPFASPRPAAERTVWRSLLVAALPIGATLAVTEVYFRADTLIVSIFRDYDEVGYYSLSYRIVELIAVFPAIVMTSVFPLLSRYLHESRELAARTVDATADLFVALGAPLAAGGLVTAPQVVRLVAGDEFEAAADPLRLLLPAVALAFVSGLLGHSLIAGGRQVSALRLALAVLGFNLALNLALVPSLGIDAAATVALASEVLLVGGGLVLVRRQLGLHPRFRLLWRALVAAAVMALVLWPVDDLTLAVLLPLGAAVYLGVLWALGGIDRERLEALRG